MLRNDLQRLRSAVEGRTVFILGGGPSATPDIIEKLNRKPKKVFCINSSVKFISDPLAVMWCDESWANTNERTLATLTCPRFCVKPNALAYLTKDIKTFGNGTVLNKTGDTGFDADPNNVRGNNTGTNAINLLSNCGARQIVLVGFDMTATGSKAHFHNDYTYAIRPAVYKDLFIPSIDSMAKQMKDSGIRTKVFNANEYSALKCFEFKSLDEFL